MIAILIIFVVGGGLSVLSCAGLLKLAYVICDGRFASKRDELAPVESVQNRAAEERLDENPYASPRPYASLQEQQVGKRGG